MKIFVCVVIDLINGCEIWLCEGSVVDVVWVLIVMFGFFMLVWWDGWWLVDGGLVNFVFVLLCWVMGVDIVIVVDLNWDLFG